MTHQALPALIERLGNHGYAVVEGYFDRRLCHQLRCEAEALASDELAIDAGVGRGEAHLKDAQIRRARIRWMDRTTSAQVEFLAEAEVIRVEINRQLYLGLFAFDAQLALTPPGGFYARHVDSFRGHRNRVVSLVAYLNEGWQEAHGGCLRLWPPHAPATSIDIVPQCATLVLMLSEDVAHEVLPANRARSSVAGWFSLRP